MTDPNRAKVDQAIRNLWLTMRELSDTDAGMALFIDHDRDLWSLITRHPAIQNRLSTAVEKGQEHGS